MYRFLNRAILAVFFMSIITACGEGDTGTTPIDSSDDSKIQLEKETELTSNKDDTDDSSGSGSDSGASNTTSGDSGSETGSSGQGFKSNSDATLEASRSPIYGGGGVKSPQIEPEKTPRACLPFAIITQGWKTCPIITHRPLSRANQRF